jgi:hypothetical protein
MRKTRIILALLGSLLPGAAWAQDAVLQTGPSAPSRAPMYVGQGGQAVVIDSGPAAGGGVGVGLSELGITAQGSGAPPYQGQGTGPNGTVHCEYDAPITNAGTGGYHFLCFSPWAGAGALIDYGAAGGASNLPLVISVNGSTFEFNAPSAFALLPTCTSLIEGSTSPITDSATNTWGATISGSGSYHVSGYCDGAAWTVSAK